MGDKSPNFTTLCTVQHARGAESRKLVTIAVHGG